MKLNFVVLVVILVTMDFTVQASIHGGGRRGRRRGSGCIIYGGRRLPTTESYYANKDRAKIIKSSNFKQYYKVGRKITFMCVATGVPRPEITWFKNGYELYDHKFFSVHETHVDNKTIKSKMEIEPATQKDAGYYECLANNLFAIDRRRFYTNYITLLF